MTPINKLLPLLHKARSKGQNKWAACCPGHEDKSPSLAIRELEDGRVLLHCFGGCSVLNVISSLSLTLSDLYPDNPQAQKSERAPFPALQILKAIKSEAGIIALAAGDILAGKSISPTDFVRIELARERIIDAIILAGG